MIGVIVITAQHIGFVVILVLDGDIQAAHALSEKLRHINALGPATVGMTAPAYINISNILQSFPILTFQKCGHTGAIGSLSIAKNAEGCLTPGLLLLQAFALLQLLGVCLHMLAYKVQVLRLILRRRQQHCLIHHVNNRRHSITEKTADTRCHINTRTLQLGKRYQLQSVNALAAALVFWPYAHQVQKLGNALAMAAHIGAGPKDHAHILRIMTLFGNKAFYSLISKRCANFPGGRSGQRARVDAIKVASCRQQVGTTARGCATRPGLDIFSLKGSEHISDFLLRLQQVRIYLIDNIFAHLLQLSLIDIFCLR